MKKQFIIFLILIFVLGLTPINFSFAITQNQINAEVQIVCPDNYGNWFSGSGTVIDPKGIILTNKHVVTDQYGSIIKTCFIGFTEFINQEPNFGTQTSPNLAEVKYYTTTADMDAAILYLNNLTNKTYTYVNIWDSNSDSLKFGDKIEVIGFPSIGGSTITYTSGDFSGFGSSLDGTQNYIKTDALIEHGNSGGAAYNSSGKFIGIPTMVIPGPLESLGYLLSVNSINNWLSGFLGSGYQKEVIEQKPVIEKPKTSIQNDITPPDINTLKISFGRYLKWNDNQNIYSNAGTGWADNFVIAKYNKIKFSVYGTKDDGGIAGYYYYVGRNIGADPVSVGKYIGFNPQNKSNNYQEIDEVITLNEEGVYYIIVAVKDNAGNISNNFIATYIYESDDYKKIDNIEFFKDRKKTESLGVYDFKFSSGDVYLGDGLWSRIDSSNSLDDVLSCKTRLKNLYFKWNYPQSMGDGKSFVVYKNNLSLFEMIAGNESESNSYEILNIDKGQKIKGFYYAVFDFDISKNGSIVFGPDNQIYYNIYIKPKKSNNLLFNNNRVVSFVYSPGLNTDITCVSEYDIRKIVLKNNRDYNFYNEDIGYNSLKKFSTDHGFINKLNGYILLQVEENGEAYYVYPDDSKRYYLGRPADAFNLMRKLGLGATHKFITSYTTYPTHVVGKILIDIEDSGKAYYIYSKDKKAYYLGRPSDAFQIMRNLGLGITNANIRKIDVGEVN